MTVFQSPKTDTIIDTQNVTVGIYSSHESAEAAIRELEKSGFDMKQLSIIGKDYHTEKQALGFYDTGERIKVWGKLGAFKIKGDFVDATCS